MFIILIFKQTFDKMPNLSKEAIAIEKQRRAHLHTHGKFAQRRNIFKSVQLYASEEDRRKCGQRYDERHNHGDARKKQTQKQQKQQ